MHKEEALAKIREIGLIAVLRGPSPELTLKMVDALAAGGVLGIEITYTTPNAPEVVKSLSSKYGDQIMLGMGTLTQSEHAQQALDAGASFIVSPHGEAELAKAMVDTKLAVIIGALSPSEIVQARKWGADIVKVFPGSLGGSAYLKALRGPYPNIPIIPTGGVSIDNVADWFEAGAFAVGAGSTLCPSGFATEGRFDDITERARAFVMEVERARSMK